MHYEITAGRAAGGGELDREFVAVPNLAVPNPTQSRQDTIPRPNTVYSALAGQTWSFQAWYRDASVSVATSNFTQAVALPLQ
ncbi:hypothetical protein Poly30_01320 [Planctomycetes bacterium Poly30]|uniref:Uncharacterized protein n=1 Tax=Saltatorellus ferox TaxID=2528018 RepID=A0A518EKS6_9BACT|nr:hypothetical protein Poly30_01320 [Planctomycetes bacterium Poly30]